MGLRDDLPRPLSSYATRHRARVPMAVDAEARTAEKGRPAEMGRPPQLPELVVHTPTTAGGGGRRKARAAAAAAAITGGAVRKSEGENAYVFSLTKGSSEKAVVALRALVESLKPTSGPKGQLTSKRWRLHAEQPTWKSDIRWVSAADEATFRGLFEPLWHKLGVAEHFRFLGEMVLFSGFFVLRRDTRKSHFHKDFGDTGNRAFTLMTPLYDMSNLADCHLLCRVAASPHSEAALPDVSEEAAATAEEHWVTKQYRYKVGEAIVFGDGFEHATQTGVAPQQLAFLCFTFGDRHCTPEQWSAAEAYIREQGPVYQDPGGNLVRGGGRGGAGGGAA